jgi:hypothetical protein
MKSFSAIALVVVASAFLVACGSSSQVASQEPLPGSMGVPNAVGFDIEPMPSDGTTTRWLATHTTDGKTARFQIEFSPAKPLNDKESQKFSVASGTGRFIAVPGSDASALLAVLRRALKAKALPGKVRRLPEVRFTFVSFGTNQSQAPGGGFRPKPPGHWTPMKIFLGEGEQEAEVFLNIDAVGKKGQFSIKDPDYGDLVLAQLAQIL